MSNIDVTLYANDLIWQALSTLRIKTPFSAISGDDEVEGMQMLNEILADMNSNDDMVPFFYDQEFTLVAQQSKYYLGRGTAADVNMNYPPEISFINIFYSELLYPVKIITDMMALYTIRNTDITFIPSQARVYREQDSDGVTNTVVDFLYPPDQAYTAVVRYKPSLDQVGFLSYLNDLPKYYSSYLRLELARKLVPFYGVQDNWTPGIEQQYQEAKLRILNSVERNLDVTPENALLGNGNYFWYTRLGVR